MSLLNNCEEIGRLLGGMMAKANLFYQPAGKALRETTAECFGNNSWLLTTDH